MCIRDSPIIDTQTRTATIAISTSLSAAIALPPGWYPAAILMPAAWTAADLTFQLSLDGTTFADLYDEAGFIGRTAQTVLLSSR